MALVHYDSAQRAVIKLRTNPWLMSLSIQHVMRLVRNSFFRFVPLLQHQQPYQFRVTSSYLYVLCAHITRLTDIDELRETKGQKGRFGPTCTSICLSVFMSACGPVQRAGSFQIIPSYRGRGWLKLSDWKQRDFGTCRFINSR